MLASAPAASAAAIIFIPASTSPRGRSEAFDFTSQLEDLKAALNAMPPDDAGRAAVAGKSDTGSGMSGNRKRDAGRPTNAADTKDNSAESAAASATALQDAVRSLANRGNGQIPVPASETVPESPQRPAQAAGDSSITITRTNQVDPQTPLSFAARIQGPESQTGSPQDGQSRQTAEPAGAQASGWKKAQQDEQAADSSAAAAGPVSAAAGPALNTAMNSGAIDSAVPTPAAPAQNATHEQLAAAIKEPEAIAPDQVQSSGGQLKDLTFNIAQPGGSTVQLRMVEHAGELRVAVHTNSPELNQELRADLPDLTRKLSDTGGHAELWRPEGHSTAASSSSDAAESQNQGGSGSNPGEKQGGNSLNSQSQSGGSQQGRGQGGQNQYQRPKWVEELENGMQSATKSTGETYGIPS